MTARTWSVERGRFSFPLLQCDAHTRAWTVAPPCACYSLPEAEKLFGEALLQLLTRMFHL